MTTPPLRTARLDLEPLTVEHAGEMVGVLADPALYVVTGGEPPSLDDLRERYRRQTAGASPDGSETWHNWVMRLRSTGEAVGFVQATVTGDVAELAWVVGTAYQGQGYAAEAAAAARDAMGPAGEVRACIAPGHTASERVARRLGLVATEETVEGETVWSSRG